MILLKQHLKVEAWLRFRSSVKDKHITIKNDLIYTEELNYNHIKIKCYDIFELYWFSF